MSPSFRRAKRCEEEIAEGHTQIVLFREEANAGGHAQIVDSREESHSPADDSQVEYILVVQKIVNHVVPRVAVLRRNGHLAGAGDFAQNVHQEDKQELLLIDR